MALNAPPNAPDPSVKNASLSEMKLMGRLAMNATVADFLA